MTIRLESKGKEVKELQEFLGITADGHFGANTWTEVVKWQKANGLEADGIVGSKTWDAMGLATTDASELIYETENCLQIERYYLPKGEYKEGPTDKEYLFLHHTAGWHNPYKQVDQWAKDNRGAVGTEFIIGGPSIKGDDDRYDGVVLQCIPEGGYGWHLGKNGSQHMHTHSVGIEVCNFGWIKNGKTYAGTKAHESQIVTLDKEFRGYKDWHRYSDKQLDSLKKLIVHIANRDNIQVTDGIVKKIREKGAGGFDFVKDAYNGKMPGLLNHTMTRTDKTDMFPQQELMDMLLSL